jgi:hypothetical protein
MRFSVVFFIVSSIRHKIIGVKHKITVDIPRMLCNDGFVAQHRRHHI